MRGSEEKKVEWSELSPDLLRSVFERLSIIDINSGKLVCWSWHSASRGCLPKRVPCLILFPAHRKEEEDKMKSSSCVLSVIEEDGRVYKRRTRDFGVDFVRSCCVATYGSWLLMMDEQWNLNILNPLTGERIDLQVTNSLVLRKSRRSFKACLWIDEESNDYLVVWWMTNTLFFIKKGSNEWRQVFSDYQVQREYKQMVYNHKTQKLYIHCKGETPTIWCFSEEDPYKVVVERCSIPMQFSCTDFLHHYDLNGERLIEEQHLFWKDFVKSWVNIAITVSGHVLKITSLLKRHNKWQFQIFKLYEWLSLKERIDLRKRIITLGDEALLLDMGITVVAKDIPGIKRNSIYFSGFGYGRNNPAHIFVFDLSTQDLQLLPRSILSHIIFSNARWFFPSFSH